MAWTQVTSSQQVVTAVLSTAELVRLCWHQAWERKTRPSAWAQVEAEAAAAHAYTYSDARHPLAPASEAPVPDRDTELYISRVLYCTIVCVRLMS